MLATQIGRPKPGLLLFNIEMICSSLNLLRFIRSSLCDVGLYQNLEEI